MIMFGTRAHLYQVRVGRSEFWHADEYGAALAEFRNSGIDNSDCEVTLWQRSSNELHWWLVSLANPCPLPSEYVRYADLFAGLTLAPSFHLAFETRERLAALGWPAPPDAVSWNYVEPVQPLPEETSSVVQPTTKAIETADEIDVEAWAADPGCRVDAAALRLRLDLGWPLIRAMTTPMTGYDPREASVFWDPKTRRFRPIPPGQRKRS